MGTSQPGPSPSVGDAPAPSRSLLTWPVPVLLFVAVFALYAATAARATLFGDPSEYQFIPAIGGIAHPPGYAFYTLLARVWQALIPVSTVAFRTNLLSGAVGAWAVTAVYLISWELCAAMAQATSRPLPRVASIIVSLFAALSLAVAPDFWQHAIHANSHIVSAALATTQLLLLVRWWLTGQDGWLAGFAFALGLGASHHPVTLIGLPAYAIFILVVRPRILLQWRTLLVMVLCGLLGLAPLLYYPLRSPTAPFGPTDMRTWQGFWRHVTAQGLRGNLFHFGLADQPHRAIVFWSLLSLQFMLPVILLMGVGLVVLIRRAPKAALLIGAFVTIHLLFTLNTVQDVMAYLLLPFCALAVLAGAGAYLLAQLLFQFARRRDRQAREGEARGEPGGRPATFLALVLLLLPWPFLQLGLNLSRSISLSDFNAAEEYVDAVLGRFGGRGEGAVLLSDWEHLTPLWVHTYTQGADLSVDDVKLVYVSTSNPWVESVWAHIEDGPIYLPDYRPAVRDEGFRLVPEGRFYRVVAPPVEGLVPDHALDVWAGERVHLLGYDLPQTTVRAGDPLVLALYQSAPEPVGGIWMPYAHLGPIEARWSTDSRLLTTGWAPGEVIVEQYEIPIPHSLEPGEYPLRLGYADLSGGNPELTFSDGSTAVDLATIVVLPAAASPSAKALESTLANFDNQIALVAARAWARGQAREAVWQEPRPVQAGRPLHLALVWRAISSPRESYTVFIHLLDAEGRYVAGHDYTPLGGASPTYLWFPKWLPGQTYLDPYRFVLPRDLPAGEYWLEVGMYGMTSLRRLPVVDWAGNLAGDRVILGPVQAQGASG